jgi:hypothetical protein
MTYKTGEYYVVISPAAAVLRHSAPPFSSLVTVAMLQTPASKQTAWTQILDDHRVNSVLFYAARAQRTLETFTNGSNVNLNRKYSLRN